MPTSASLCEIGTRWRNKVGITKLIYTRYDIVNLSRELCCLIKKIIMILRQKEKIVVTKRNRLNAQHTDPDPLPMNTKSLTNYIITLPPLYDPTHWPRSMHKSITSNPTHLRNLQLAIFCSLMPQNFCLHCFSSFIFFLEFSEIIMPPATNRIELNKNFARSNFLHINDWWIYAFHYWKSLQYVNEFFVTMNV